MLHKTPPFPSRLFPRREKRATANPRHQPRGSSGLVGTGASQFLVTWLRARPDRPSESSPGLSASARCPGGTRADAELRPERAREGMGAEGTRRHTTANLRNNRSLALSGRWLWGTVYPRASLRSALGWVLAARWAAGESVQGTGRRLGCQCFPACLQESEMRRVGTPPAATCRYPSTCRRPFPRRP